MQKQIITLQDFYQQMNRSRDIRRRITQDRLMGKDVDPADTSALTQILQALEGISHSEGTYKLKLDAKRFIAVDLHYEIHELKKDLYFLTHSLQEFQQYLMAFCPTFQTEVDALVQQLQAIPFHAFITDRDGTVNNYCGRYASSVQSVYNAVFLCQYAKRSVRQAVVLTSAPLKNIGLVDISVAPPGYFIYAGSKGREYVDHNNNEHRFPLEEQQSRIISDLNDRLSGLLKRPAYEKFTLIGSGLQFKFGQTTVARQDISASIDARESLAFKTTVEKLVRDIDPSGQHFRIEDTGKDIEIILTIPDDHLQKGLKDFDKGDALDFLNQDIPLHLDKGPALVCGDTASDLPMMVTAQNLSAQAWGVLVTTDAGLKRQAEQCCQNILFVSCPDVLVTALDQLSTK